MPQWIYLYRQWLLRELQLRFRSSALGVAWLVLQPLAQILLFTLVFYKFFRVRWPAGDGSISEYSLQVFIGLTLFAFVSDVINRAPSSVSSFPFLITKVRFPLLLLPSVVVGAGTVQLGLSLCIAIGFALWREAHWQALALLREGPRQEELDRAAAELRARQAAVEIAQRQRAYTALSSPVAGVVAVRLAEKGEVVAAGKPVLRIAELGQPWIRAYLNETDLGRVRLGQAAEVRVDSLPGAVLSGRLAFIAPDAEFTPKTVETRALRVDLVYRVKIEVANPDGALKLGMPADVRLKAAAP